MKPKFKDGALVRNIREGYIGRVSGTTKIRKLFEGDKNVDFQYRILPEKAGGAPFKFAAEHELELVTDRTITDWLPTQSDMNMKRKAIPDLSEYGYCVWDPGTRRPTPAYKRHNDLRAFVKDQGLEATVKKINNLMEREISQDFAITVWISDLKWLEEQCPGHSKLFDPLFANYRKAGLMKG